MNKRGFTLIEAAVTLTIMGIVAAAAIGSFAALTKVAKQAERDVVLVETLRTGLLYMLSELRLAGGGGIPNWSAAIIEDTCDGRGGLPDCRTSDRLTIVQAIPTFPACRISEDLGDRVSFRQGGGSGGGGSCCYLENNFVRQAALIFPDTPRFGRASDETMQPVIIRDLPGDDCEFQIIPIVASENLPRPLSENQSFRDKARRDATAILADVKTFYVDWQTETRGALTMHVELNGDGNVVGERLTILESVADFQASLGYNVPGRPMQESSSGIGDAWWPGTPDETGNASAADPQLRPESVSFIGVSAIVVDIGANKTTHVQTPWGPPRTFNGLRAMVGSERIGLQE